MKRVVLEISTKVKLTEPSDKNKLTVQQTAAKITL
jgi:hypothetical protein